MGTRWWVGFRFWSVVGSVLVAAALGVVTNVATSTPKWGWIVGGAALLMATLSLSIADLASSARARTAQALADRAEIMDPTWPDPALDLTGPRVADDPGGVVFWLDARFCPSPLWGRAKPRRELTDWCQQQDDVVRIVSGPGGVGKSRLVVELARHHLPDGWFAGRPDPARLADVVPRVLACGQPALLLIEDAERVAGLASFLQQVARAERIRVILTSRDGAALRDRLREDPDTALGPILRASVLVLPVVSDAGDRHRLYVEAIRCYAHVLRMPRPDVPANAVVGRGEDTMLLLQARALLAVLDRPDTRTLGLAEVVRELVGQEEQRWARDPTLPTQPAAVAEAVGVLSLLPATDLVAAADLLRSLPQFAHDSSQSDRVALARWARTRYPVSPGGRLDVRPHLVGEWLALQVAETVTELPPDLVVSVAIMVTRACSSLPERLPVLWQVLAAHPQVAAEVVPVVLDQDLPFPAVDRGLEAVLLAAPPDQAEALLALSVPDHYAHTLCAQRTLGVRGLRDRHGPELATALTELGISLRDLGRARDGLPVHREAVGIWRALMAAEPNQHRIALATSLHGLGNCLWDVGQSGEALSFDEEVVKIWRDLATGEPDRYRPELATSLHALGVDLWEIGHVRKALAVTEEAVKIRRDLALTDSDCRPDLANSLDSLCAGLWEIGQVRETMAIAEEAVAIWRDLTTSEPNRYRRGLAEALTRLGGCLRGLRRTEALACTEEAVMIWRDLTAIEPNRHRPGLADALTRLGGCLRQLQRTVEALAISEEAVTIWRDLSAAGSDRYRSQFASSLDDLALCLLAGDRTADALVAFRAAIEIQRCLATTGPARFRHDLAQSLCDLGICLARTDRLAEELAADQEATEIWQELSAIEPDRYRASLAHGLENRGISLDKAGRSAEALLCGQEALALWRVCAERDPERFGDQYRALAARLPERER